MSNAVVEVYGCSANSADAEIISGLLCEAGYKVDDIDKIDVMILLTCIVKTPTENKITKRIRELVKEGNPLVVAGCMPQALKTMVEELAPSASMVGP
ncbi:2-methylthioadenine synthetase, partial [Candidatus Bathyarchaeota archaeon]|nr:2-methylthioadenine synthetase [Candidatus Bathyarchaeota archaeon]